jgi:hypothetical protein
LPPFYNSYLNPEPAFERAAKKAGTVASKKRAKLQLPSRLTFPRPEAPRSGLEGRFLWAPTRRAGLASRWMRTVEETPISEAAARELREIKEKSALDDSTESPRP